MHYWFCELCNSLMIVSVFFRVSLTRCLSTWILFTLELSHMTFCPRRIVSTIGSVHSGFCSRLILSSWKSVQLGVFLLGFFSSWESLDSAHVLFCLIGIIFTLVFVYLAAFCLQVWPHDILLRWDCVHCWFCQLWILLTCGSFYFKVSPPGCSSTRN